MSIRQQLTDALDEELARREGTADLADDNGVVFGTAVWRSGAEGERWYAVAKDDRTIRTRERTVALVTKRLARKIEEKRR